MRLLITGGRGQLGNELRRCLETMTAEAGPVPAEYAGAQFDCIDYQEMDISSAESVDAWFAAHEYDLVVNCAAVTNVDGCETNEEGAYAVNALGPQNLARAAAAQGAKFLQVSTDYVFPGNVPGDRVEDDEVGPISAYGRTKLAGEQLAAAANPRTFVCRTAWLYGYVGKNFVKTMKRLGEGHDKITVVDDQVGNPTSANDLALAILRVALTDEYGIYHMTNNGTCSWADFAAAIMEGFGLECVVQPVTSEQYKAANPASADRPHFSSLKNARLEATVGDTFRPWREALAAYVSNFDELAD
ncbi:MAG: dTDP-4-dehydrorhamnose reductase [Coriobacteriia bacterium]|nr:dTDP-4-dehydrorhamnose reductase [Coriobacteriia bacterium]